MNIAVRSAHLFMMITICSLVPFATYCADSIEDALKSLNGNLQALEKVVEEKKGVQVSRTVSAGAPIVPLQEAIVKKKAALKPVPVKKPGGEKLPGEPEENPSLEGVLQSALAKLRPIVKQEETEEEEDDDWD